MKVKDIISLLQNFSPNVNIHPKELSLHLATGFENKKQEAEKLAIILEKYGFIDGTDANAKDSFVAENGILRNPQTGYVAYCIVNCESQSVSYDFSVVTADDVIDSLNCISDGFFKMMSSSRQKEMDAVEKDPQYLAGIIQNLNMYNGVYQQSCAWDETAHSLLRALEII